MNSELLLTILINVVSGKDSMRRNLRALCPQVDFSEMEIIVPFDKWSEEIGELAAEFPEVRFHFIKDAAISAQKKISAGGHWLYDLRRTVGLKLSRGRLIAITEDRAEPEEDWIQQILFLHEQPFEVIGGAIENGVERRLIGPGIIAISGGMEGLLRMKKKITFPISMSLTNGMLCLQFLRYGTKNIRKPLFTGP